MVIGRMKKTIIFFLILFSFNSFSEDQHLIDSLRNKLNLNLPDSIRVQTLRSLGWEVSYGNFQEGLNYCLQARDLAEKINYKYGLSNSLNAIGAIYTDMGDYPAAIEAHLRQIEINKELNYTLGLGIGYNNLARVYDNLQQRDTSLYYSLLSIEQYEKEKQRILKKIFKDEKQRNEEMNSLLSKFSTAYSNIAQSYVVFEKYDSAISYLSKAMEISRKLDNALFLIQNYKVLGKIYTEHHKLYEQAEDSLKKAVSLCFAIHDEYDLPEIYELLGTIKLSQRKCPEAINYFEKVIIVANKLGYKGERMKAYFGLSNVYKEMNQTEESYKWFKRYSEIKDTILYDNQREQVTLIQSKLENEKNKAKIITQKQENEILEAESSRKQIAIYAIAILCLIGGFFVYTLSKRNKEKREANKLLYEQKEKIEYQNKELTDSINYAQTIQKAILPESSEIKKAFPDSFVLFKPRDIVSGDFYWFKQKGNRKFIAAVDCTGHGVPGAFMSMISNTLLHEIVDNKNILQPSKILDELKKDIVKSLKQTGATGENKDGMDIALCMLEGNKLEYAGANNPLWIVSKGELTAMKADAQPVGISYGEEKEFTNHSFELEQGSAFYIFTDGYADQFGGPKGKKFKYSQLKELLLSIQSDNILSQHEKLFTTFADWKGNLDQIDDVLVIGVRIS